MCTQGVDADLSFLDVCHDCLQRGHKLWESYFSKWDFLAKNEETLTESGSIEKLNEDVDQKKRVQKTNNTNQKKKRKKGIIQKRAKNCKKLPSRSSANRLLLRKRKTTRHKSVKKKPQRKKKTPKVSESNSEPDLIEYYEGLMDDSDDDLGEDFTTVNLHRLLKETQLGEVFGVSSQTITREEVVIKSYCGLESSPKLGNEDESGRCLSITNQDIVPINDKMTIFQTRSPSGRLNSLKRPDRTLELLDGKQILNNLRNARGHGCLDSSSNLNQTFPVCKFKESGCGAVSPYKPSNPLYPMPKTDFNMMTGISKGIYNVKDLTHSYLNNSQNESKKRLKPLPLNLSGTSGGGEGSKINIDKLSLQKARLLDVPEVNVGREKTFQNICLHKRTGDVSLDMGNSNFVTPKRNAPERKCFSENIVRGKKRGRSKLSFFDYVQDDDGDSDSGDPSENRSPVILWESKRPKTETEEIKIGDSDDLEHIFDRVRKP